MAQSMSTFADRFKDRVAVVTGGASGAGKETAARIVREGGKAILWDMNAQALAAAKEEVGASRIIALDVADPAAVARAAHDSNAVHGRVDILVVAAGITGATAPVKEYPVESWLRVMDVNLNGAFYCAREIVHFMLAHDYGRIVNISSVAGKEGNPNASAYSTSKAGLIGFTKSLGKELAATGIRVNCVTPATFKSPILDQLPQSQIDYMRSRIPMGRLGEIE
jgi:NAD(P)-dependent dehydrogenase (short-subunit alcohol dehydrogenase family)